MYFICMNLRSVGFRELEAEHRKATFIFGGVYGIAVTGQTWTQSQLWE